MSFILDALKKADAERHLGELPGLHAVPLPAASVTRNARRSWRWPLVGIVVLGAAVATLSVLRPWQQQAAGAVASQAPGPAVAAPTPATDAVSPTVIATPAVATEVPAPAPLPAPPKPPSRPAATAAMPATAKPQNAADAAKAEKAAPVNAMALAQLPPAVRSELPAMAIGGSMYSANPADRMLLVDKRMLHEGDEISPGLLLESIHQKSAILRYKGFVFRLPF